MPVRSPYVLAALATAAVPRLEPRAVSWLAVPGDYDAARIVTTSGETVEVRAPRTARAGAELAAEVELLAELVRYRASGALPFDVPEIIGSVVPNPGRSGKPRRVKSGIRFSTDDEDPPRAPEPPQQTGQVIVQRSLPGEELALARISGNAELAANLGRAVAAIHKLPTEVIDNSGLPVYSAPEYQERLLAELDESAETGKIPAVLLRRWEDKLEDVATWKFQPVVVHGDLDAELVRVADDAVTAISGWSHARVADPADDLVWLAAAASQPEWDTIMTAYQGERGHFVDPHLRERALLGGELALARWLRHGTLNELPDVVADAEAMLLDLAREFE